MSTNDFIYDEKGTNFAEQEVVTEEISTSKYADGRIVLDWISDKDFCLENGIEWDFLNHLTLQNSRDIVVRNFPYIHVKDVALENCVFENCNNVYVEDGFVTNCIFDNVDYISFSDVKVSLSTFKNCETDSYEDSEIPRENQHLIFLRDSKITDSRFENIRFYGSAYFFEAWGSCEVKKCQFSDIFSSRTDKKIYKYEVTTGRGIFKETYSKNLFCEDTCTGLDSIKENTKHKRTVFHMEKSDIFTVEGKGIVISGIVSLGTVKVGDTVTCFGVDILTAKVLGISKGRELQDEATVGEDVGILLSGIKKDDMDYYKTYITKQIIE